MRGIWIAAAVALLVPTATLARVAPLTREQQIKVERQNALENAMRRRFSDSVFNHVRDMYASIIVAEERRGVPLPPRVLVKDEYGWHELLPTGQRKLPKSVSHELSTLLLDGDLWREEPYFAGQPCRGSTLVFVLRHSGQGDRYGRQPCTTSGLAGRAAEVAATLRLPAKLAVTTAPPERMEGPPGLPEAEYRAGRHMYGRLSEMVWSWERRSFVGFVDPFADNAIVELPGRTLRGRQAVLEWARSLQDWSTGPGWNRMLLHRSEWPRPQNNHAVGRWEVRWGEDEGRPMRRTYSATWVNSRGLWQIAHMRVSEDKPVTNERQVW